MIGHYRKQVGPRFDRGNWSGPRFFRHYAFSERQTAVVKGYEEDALI
jgi:hypothetical protein